MNCIYNATGSYVCQPMPKNQPKNGSSKPNDSCPSCSLRNQVGPRREVVGEYQSTFNMAEIYEDVRFKGRSASPRMARTESPRARARSEVARVLAEGKRN